MKEKSITKKLVDEQDIHFPEGSKLWKDTGYQGYEPKNVTLYQPTKEPIGKELTAEQKEQNRQISKDRIRVEHSIGSVKIFGIMREVNRNIREGFDDLIMETACDLHNLRCDFPMNA